MYTYTYVYKYVCIYIYINRSSVFKHGVVDFPALLTVLSVCVYTHAYTYIPIHMNMFIYT